MLGLRFCAGLSLVAASGGHSSSRCAGLSLSRPLLLRSTGSRRTGSVIVAHGPSCSAACGIFPDQGSKPCPLHWQADSQPLRHQGSPTVVLTHGCKLFAIPFIKRWGLHSCFLNLVRLGIASLIENEPRQNIPVKGLDVQVIYRSVQRIKGRPSWVDWKQRD